MLKKDDFGSLTFRIKLLEPFYGMVMQTVAVLDIVMLVDNDDTDSVISEHIIVTTKFARGVKVKSAR